MPEKILEKELPKLFWLSQAVFDKTKIRILLPSSSDRFQQSNHRFVPAVPHQKINDGKGSANGMPFKIRHLMLLAHGFFYTLVIEQIENVFLLLCFIHRIFRRHNRKEKYNHIPAQKRIGFLVGDDRVHPRFFCKFPRTRLQIVKRFLNAGRKRTGYAPGPFQVQQRCVRIESNSIGTAV